MALLEETLISQGMINIAGVDEAGRGSCAGPLVVAAVILQDPLSSTWKEVRDSKKLTAKNRDALYDHIIAHSLCYSIVEVNVSEIDQKGLHYCNLEGMRRAIQLLTQSPEYVITDGYPISGLDQPSLGVWKGDQVAISVSAASILAKVSRDRIMQSLAEMYPQYGFGRHKGYITRAHTEALQQFGVSPVHRMSFANIQALAQR